MLSKNFFQIDYIHGDTELSFVTIMFIVCFYVNRSCLELLSPTNVNLFHWSNSIGVVYPSHKRKDMLPCLSVTSKQCHGPGNSGQKRLKTKEVDGVSSLASQHSLKSVIMSPKSSNHQPHNYDLAPNYRCPRHQVVVAVRCRTLCFVIEVIHNFRSGGCASHL